MNQKVLNSIEKKGLTCPFIATQSGDVTVANSGVTVKKELSQMSTIIFETIGAVGDVHIDRIELYGSQKGLLLEIADESLIGSVFESTLETDIESLWNLIGELRGAPVVATPGEKPKEKPKVEIDASVLDTMKEAMKEYLGDFTERIYKNQLKAQRIKVDDLYDEDARRLVFALGKAAGMIIGPSKGREMTNKLLELLK